MRTPRAFRPALIAIALGVVGGGCSSSTNPPVTPTGVTPASHQWFPITAGSSHELGKMTANDGVIACESCHIATADSFTDFTCTSCHTHAQDTNDRLHTSVSAYTYTPQSCYSCHPKGEKITFDHAGISDGCSACHETTAAFAVTRPADHVSFGSGDCSGCHKGFVDWKGASGAPTDSSDPSQTIIVIGQQPLVGPGPKFSSFTAIQQALPMMMNHASTAIPAEAFVGRAGKTGCANCHSQADQGVYVYGTFHASLEALTLPQPKACGECHRATAATGTMNAAMPTGFVGPNGPGRTPASPEMRHEAVAWANGAPTTTALVTQDCSVCHLPPTDALPSDWSTNKGGSSPSAFHSSLKAASLPQPTSCIDCHMNSRPVGIVAAGSVQFDHDQAMGDCATCHSNGGATQYTSWSKGQYHLAGNTPPTSCASCHEGERPTSTTGWKSTTYTAKPFDYGGSADGGTSHGAGGECASCHLGPGTGAWGGTQNWVGGNFVHGPNTASESACIDCHSTQRPDLQPGATAAGMKTLLGFDHSVNGTGDCFGCHQATVVAGKYDTYFTITTKSSGNWKDGISYPGDFLQPTGRTVSVSTIVLARDSKNWVTGMSTVSPPPLKNAMKHTSSALPAAFNAGPSSNPDDTKCHLCHVSPTIYAGGLLHASLTDAGVAQPTECLDCHKQMRPPNIVEKSASALVPMDHAAAFTGPVTINGVSVISVDTRNASDTTHLGMDCGGCHSQAGNTWADGKFHSKIAGATPADCTTCHYPLMAAGAVADVTSAKFTMKHQSAQTTVQACQTCHTTALAQSTGTPDAGLWKTGTLHAGLSTQPTTCLDCHTASAPTTSTTSTVTYTMPLGGTGTNGTQWMSHTVPAVLGKDCALCHLADAAAKPPTWSKSASVHPYVTGLTTCNSCHGLTNGNGSVAGTKNNLPSGLTNSTTVTTSSAAAAGTLDQIAHTDINASTPACVLCHTQVGVAAPGPIQGKEWAQASFHKNFTGSNVLVLNGTTGRCSNCHLNVKPGPSYAAQDHSAFTATSVDDCNKCHAWPGTSTTTPNWLGASGKPHGTSGTTVGATYDCKSCHGQAGSATEHLTVPEANHYGGSFGGNTCISCHIDYTSFGPTTATILYKHTGFSTTAVTDCTICHKFQSGLYTTLTTTPKLTFPTAGNAHQFSQTTSVSGSKDNDTFTSNHQNTNMTNCSACHKYATTTATNNVWAFSHRGTMSAATKTTGRGLNGCNMCHEHQ